MGAEFGDADCVCIIADDLTGALDTAGSFASPSQPFEISLGDGPPSGARVAIDTDSRDMTEPNAARRVADAVAAVDTGRSALVFKKIDSVMRGHPVTETVAALRAGEFDRALVAPAFPALGRVTRNARQMVLEAAGARPVGPCLPEAFRTHGFRVVRLGEAMDHAEIIVADAEDTADLTRVIAQVRDLGGRTLYVGSAGLAHALAPETLAPLDVPNVDLAICGTLHPMTLAQIERVKGLATAIETMDGGLGCSDGLPSVLIAPAGIASENLARRRIAQSLAALARDCPAPRTAMVTGGWTLRTLLDETGAERLLCLGLHMPGVPVSRVVGGRWHGVTIVSKSGGFGDADFLLKLLVPRF